jgi:hypothetical protein
MKKIFIKKVLTISVISLFFVQMLYILAEPTTAVALTTDNVIVTLNVDAGVSISDGANTTMAPNIGVTQMKSVGSSSWVVATNNAAGYTLAVHASTTPALYKPPVPGAADQFNDYTPAVANTPDAWGGVLASSKEFGFSARGTDVLAKFGTATTCGNTGTGVPDANSYFLGFNGSTDLQIATKNTVTTPSGVTTNICFAAEQGNAIYAASGTYTATITATAAVI